MLLFILMITEGAGAADTNMASFYVCILFSLYILTTYGAPMSMDMGTVVSSGIIVPFAEYICKK
jgi:hypothetical protein